MSSEDTIIGKVLKANDQWAQGFDKPMKLGVKKRLVVLTCMDSRLIPEAFLGLDIGDAEIIRNGGGRVTLDVLRSMVITQDLLSCDHVLVIHHTDCGGQAAVRRKEEWQQKMCRHMNHASLPVKMLFYSVWWSSYITPAFIRRSLLHWLVRPIPDLAESIVEDVKLLRKAPNVEPHVKLYGLLYNTETGRLTEMCRDEGGGLILTNAYRQTKQQDSVNGPSGYAPGQQRKGSHGRHSSAGGSSKGPPQQQQQQQGGGGAAASAGNAKGGKTS